VLVQVFLYLVFCVLVGYAGRRRKFGFWGYLLASIVLSPLIGLLLVAASSQRVPRATPPAGQR
jgi:hypothetical protein